MVTVIPAIMKGTEVAMMVVFRPNFSSANPPDRPPARAARGIKDPIQDASVSVMVMGEAGAWSEAMAGEDQAEVKPTTREPSDTASAALENSIISIGESSCQDISTLFVPSYILTRRSVRSP